MAMYGWVASREGGDLDPSVKQSLKPFSKDGGKGPFKFVVDTVADSNGADSKIHTVWIEVYDKDTNDKKGEISVELSDKMDGISTSEDVTLAMCLTKLGFVDDSHGDTSSSNPEPPSTPGLVADPTEPPVDDLLGPQAKTAARLAHLFKVATLRESLDSFLQD